MRNSRLSTALKDPIVPESDPKSPGFNGLSGKRKIEKEITFKHPQIFFEGAFKVHFERIRSD